MAVADPTSWLIAHGDIDRAEQIIADLEATTIDDPWVITESKGQELLSSSLHWVCLYRVESRLTFSRNPVGRAIRTRKWYELDGSSQGQDRRW